MTEKVQNVFLIEETYYKTMFKMILFLEEKIYMYIYEYKKRLEEYQLNSVTSGVRLLTVFIFFFCLFLISTLPT